MIQSVGTSTQTAENSDQAALPSSVRLDLVVRDAEAIAELLKHDEGPSRDEFALSALRLGVLALRQASGVIDSVAVREEGSRLLANVREAMTAQSGKLLQDMNGMVKAYFDPETGVLPQRLERLVKKDGDLEAVLSRHLNGEASTIAHTLARHIGQESPIFKLLSPKQTDGLLAALSSSVEDSLKKQRDHILEQFSLDKEDSALSRLVDELTESNGELKTDLSKDLAKVMKEFSLDNQDGALSRLVGRVEKAQATISGEFSLDNKESALSRLSEMLAATDKRVAASLTLDDDKSPLSRLRSELLKVVTDLSKSNTEFQGQVRQTLDGLKIRREEAARGTQHGIEFEDAVGELLQCEAQRLNDVFEAVGATTGVIRNCKVGDHVVTLGQESAAPNAKIVFEVKENASYDVSMALAEVKKARENRAAQAGVFVFSKATAPERLELLARHGQDILVVWDHQDPGTDLLLWAAYSLARALVVRERGTEERSEADFIEIERAIAQIAKDAAGLVEITTWASTVKNSGDKIHKKADRIRDSLEKQIEQLREHFGSIKQDTSGEAK